MAAEPPDELTAFRIRRLAEAGKAALRCAANGCPAVTEATEEGAPAGWFVEFVAITGCLVVLCPRHAPGGGAR